MGNLGGAEILMIFIVGLIVLGPSKLPEAARQIGRAVNELRRVSSGFQQELKESLEEPAAETRAMMDETRSLMNSPVEEGAAPRTPPAPVVDDHDPGPGVATADPGPGDEGGDDGSAAPAEPDDR
jgi:Tat protein translocase TatB subunit